MSNLFNKGIPVYKKILWGIGAFTAFLLIGVSLYFLNPVQSKHNLKLPSESSEEVFEYLKKSGIDVGILDKIFLTFSPKPQKGWIYINKKELPRYKFLLLLSRKSIHYTPITIVPGETSYFILSSLSKKLHLSHKLLEKSYNKIAPFKEGNFLAETYNIPAYFTEERTIKFLIDKSFKKYKALSMEYFNEYNQSNWKRVLTIASIIEKEAANTQEMPIVASVIFNRLNKKMRLQMDGTLNYGSYSHTKITPERIKHDTSAYNTYKHKGLPKEPVCNVSIEALKAAITPSKTDFLYFMRNKNDYHDFTKTYQKHIKNVLKRRKERKK